MSLKKTTALHKRQMEETERSLKNRDARIDELYELALEREEILAAHGYKAVKVSKQDIKDEALSDYNKELIEKAQQDKDDVEKLLIKEFDELMKKKLGR